jgi:hypothetical protein
MFFAMHDCGSSVNTPVGTPVPDAGGARPVSCGIVAPTATKLAPILPGLHGLGLTAVPALDLLAPTL